MYQFISMMRLRQQIGSVITRVKGDFHIRYILLYRGKPVAAIIPITPLTYQAFRTQLNRYRLAKRKGKTTKSFDEWITK